MCWRTCVLLGMLAGAHGDYTPSPSPSVPGYTTPTDNSPLPSPHTPTVTYSAPTSAPYTTAVVLTQPSTPATTVSTTSSAGQTDLRANNGAYPYPYSVPDSYSPFYQQLPPNFISQYYKQPPSGYPQFQQVSSPSQTLNPPAFQPHSCTSPNNPPFHAQQPYFQSNLFQVPNPLSFLNGFAPSNSFHAMVNHPSPRGPLPSPGYYSPNHPQPQPLFSVGFTSPANRPSPYSFH